MTDIKPGSRWLLPVEIGSVGSVAVNLWMTGGSSLCQMDPRALGALIPADRITELEAEVARLKSELEKLNAHD